MQGIYMFKNNLNGHCYIGQSVNIEDRHRHHKSASKRYNYKFYKAIRKYGLENFELIILEEVSDRNNLTEREKHYCNLYKPYYNTATPTGGNGFRAHSKAVNQYDREGNLIATYDSIANAAKAANIERRRVSAVCLGEDKTAGGYIWKYA